MNRPAPLEQPEAQDGLAPTLSEAIYLFADRFMPKATLGGEPAPCTGIRVRDDELATLVVMTAFISLAERGVITFSLTQETQLLGFTKPRVLVTLSRQEAAPGIEWIVTHYLYPNPEDNSAYAIIRRWYGQDMGNPWSHVLNTVKQDLILKGYLLPRPVKENVMTTFFPVSSTPVEGVLERINAVSAVAGIAQATLERFKLANPDLNNTLLGDVRSAINSRLSLKK